MSATTIRRPIGATIVALILGWLAFGGFMNALVWRAARDSLQVPVTSPLSRFLESASSPLFSLLALTYGATALAACIGIWRMRPWMSGAFLAWGIAVAATGVWMTWALPGELLLGGKIVGLAFVAGCMALLWVAYAYIRQIAPRNAL